MATPRKFPPVKLVVALLSMNASYLEKVRAALVGIFGPIDFKDEPTPFIWSRYYRKEVGENPLRQYLSFLYLIDPGTLAEIKLQTNRLEAELAEEGLRRVNIDPGYLDLSKLVLASAKDATYRVYLGKGISGQATLFFQDGSYRDWKWTYPSYRDPGSIEFFNRVREIYRGQLAAF